MKWIRNAEEGRQSFSNAWREFRTRHMPMIERLRQELASNPLGQPSPRFDDLLEPHIRNYVVNPLLRALNWTVEPPSLENHANLFVEVPVRSVQDGTTRYLDYLGIECSNYVSSPLLVVESKRPGSPLPQQVVAESTDRRTRRRLNAPRETAQEAIIHGLRGGKLLYEWNEWLATLSDYFNSVHKHGGTAPRRVVITDGLWCIVFLRPELTLLDPANASVEHILCFESTALEENVIPVIVTRFDELFLNLDYFQLARELPGLTVSQIRFRIDTVNVESAMRGLQLKYVDDVGLFDVKPKIEVAPVVFLRPRGSGPWVRVESRRSEVLPHRQEELLNHLVQVRAHSHALSAAVKVALQRDVPFLPLEVFYASSDYFAHLRGINRTHRHDEFIIVTGIETHYLRETPSIPHCPYHDWRESWEVGEPNPELAPLAVPSTTPRAFFPNSTTHHCAHRQVSTVKAEPVHLTNRHRCGPRSARDGEPFCEIWPFEQHLCCRTCVYEAVCAQADVFQLPCRSGSSPHETAS